jgi:phosphate transport system substrate-binding protein
MQDRANTSRPVVALAIGLAVVAGALIGSTANAQKKGTIVIKGSDTMVNLGAAWAEAYMKQNPSVSVSVTGGGSGTGIAAFLNGTCDIAQSSRPMSIREVDASKQRNVLPKRTPVALDGLAVVVHTSNPLDSLSKDQVAAIFTGRISDWSQVGGKAGRIVVLSRESNSGTHVFFRENVMGNLNYRPDALMMPSTKAIQQEVTNNPNAIGYGGEAYFKGRPNCKLLPIAPKKGAEPVAPTNANVISGKYPISRPLNFYTPGAPKGLVGDFVKFCLSEAGQRIVEQVGYVPLPAKK